MVRFGRRPQNRNLFTRVFRSILPKKNHNESVGLCAEKIDIGKKRVFYSIRNIVIGIGKRLNLCNSSFESIKKQRT